MKAEILYVHTHEKGVAIMATREFKIVQRPEWAPDMVKAELTVQGDGFWAPKVSITVYKWDDCSMGVHVEAHNYIGANHEHGSVYLHYSTVQEGWKKFQMLLGLLGLKGV